MPGEPEPRGDPQAGKDLQACLLVLFPTRDPGLGGRLLEFVFSNSTWKNGCLTPNYRKPFDMLAVTNVAYKKEKAASPSKDDLLAIWLPMVDDFRTFLATQPRECIASF